MARTALQIAQQALGELGLNPVSALAGSQSQDAIQQLALLNREGMELADMEGAWPSLRGEQLITLVAGQEAYPFPTDIAYYRDGTAWDRTTHWQAMGPVSAQQWQMLRSGLLIAGNRTRYRIMGGQIHFDPVPSNTDQIVFEYISSNWCSSGSGTPQSSFLTDTDVPLLPDDLFVLGLKWRLLAARGMNYAEERAAYDMAVQRKRARSEVPGVLALNRRRDRCADIAGPGMVVIDSNPFPDGTFIIDGSNVLVDNS